MDVYLDNPSDITAFGRYLCSDEGYIFKGSSEEFYPSEVIQVNSSSYFTISLRSCESSKA